MVSERQKLWRRVSRDRSGVTAVEFALVAPPFLLLLFAIMEIGMVLFASSTLEDAVYDAGRVIRTGSLQQSGNGIEVFQPLVCDGLYGIMNCDDLIIDVRTFEDFGGVTLPSVFDGDGDDEVDEDALQFQPGGPEDIVVIRVYNDWHALTPGLAYIFGEASADTLRLSAATVFRNEPY
jgi:Flp pilus assembly pilin Flp